MTWAHPLATLASEQSQRNDTLLSDTPTLARQTRSAVLPFIVDPVRDPFSADIDVTLSALEKTAATIAVKSLISLSKVNDIDHLGGGLELIPSLLLTLAGINYDDRHFAIEHGHTSIGYYASLAALGFLPEDRVVDRFRRSLDIAGHVSWVPGGTALNSGRLGVMVPVGTGLALGLKAKKGPQAAVICHCGDAGWISGQALNGFIAASQHRAPIVFVMHRNGIQLSGTTDRILNKDPRPVVAALGIEILEIPSLHDRGALFAAYHQALTLAGAGKPSLVFPVGWRSTDRQPVTIATFGEKYAIAAETAHFAEAHGVALDTRIWIPGSIMSFRDPHAMLECLFYVNHLPGGEGHHDGGMKGRDGQAVLSNPMLALTADESAALDRLRGLPPRMVVTTARPAHGAPNLRLSPSEWAAVQLPKPDKPATPRAGSEAAYVAIARKYPERCFFVSCDLNPSTRLGKAAALLSSDHKFELSIEEQAGSLLADGLSFTGADPQLNVFATFGAFLEGIAREGFEMWRYQRNLDGVNDGLNVLMHFAHVGACTGRDHFSGWSLDWINVALGYLPYLRRFYAPADSSAAFLAVKDAASAFGGHIIGVPRDTLPVLARTGTSQPLWAANEEWTPVTAWRETPGATQAILTIGAPSYLAGEAVDEVARDGILADVHIVNGMPIPESFFAGVASRYRRVLTIEDGLIGTVDSGLRGFAGLAASALQGRGVALTHFGLTDPRVAPSDHFVEVWQHFGLTSAALAAALRAPGQP